MSGGVYELYRILGLEAKNRRRRNGGTRKGGIIGHGLIRRNTQREMRGYEVCIQVEEVKGGGERGEASGRGARALLNQRVTRLFGHVSDIAGGYKGKGKESRAQQGKSGRVLRTLKKHKTLKKGED